MADKVVQLKNKDGDNLYPVSVVPGEKILWADTMEEAPELDMTGATSTTAGDHGFAPAPSAGDQDKVLRGDGTWGLASTQNITNYTLNLNSSQVTLNRITITKIAEGLYRVFLDLKAVPTFTAGTEYQLTTGANSFKIEGNDLDFVQFSAIRRTDTSAIGMTYNKSYIYMNPSRTLSAGDDIHATGVAKTL